LRASELVVVRLTVPDSLASFLVVTRLADPERTIVAGTSKVFMLVIQPGSMSEMSFLLNSVKNADEMQC
jgi:hypothetical protein